MSDEKKESRIKVDDLPQAQKELTPEEQQQVQGGGFGLSGQPESITEKPDADTSIKDGTSNTLDASERLTNFSDGSVRA
ncbi:MAG TPA: hypothetical protein VF546_01760 [Pyrinomonadaceae bacterium]|jgi:uncharacterized protein with von Willebrand factor type A (vWA) domain